MTALAHQHPPSGVPDGTNRFLQFVLHFNSIAHRRNIRIALFWVLEQTANLIESKFPVTWRRVSAAMSWLQTWVFRFLSPAFPFTPQKPFLEHYWGIFFTGLALGYLLSFGTNWAGSWMSGTLNGSDERFEYFWTDKKNLAIYSVWAPLYFAFSFSIVALVIKDWNRVKQFADRGKGKDKDKDIATVDAMRLSFSISFIVWFSIVVTMLDYLAVINTDYTATKIYWYIAEIRNNKFTFNAAGVWHFLSNYIKLVLVVAAVLCYISFCLEILRIATNASSIASAHKNANPSRTKEGKVAAEARLNDEYKYILRAAERLFVNVIGLAIVISLHHIVWRAQPSGQNAFNIDFAHVMLILAIIFLVEMPRYRIVSLIQKEGYRFHQAHVELSESAFILKCSLAFLVARLTLYIFIWSFYFEEQLGHHFVSNLLRSFRTGLHYIGCAMGLLLDKAAFCAT